ncbi:hypothetical protein [Chitinilyticum litopenaei]|uniref:hypothetical protein n=1 Tax=Chitinilyticum litopenaei TaxID=1121276 RepID=UPI0004009864|nr:hypothetical protein [Chitinilyticum litopenaei]
MKSSDLFATLTGADLSLALSDDGGLKVSPRPTPEQAALIRQHKPELLTYLQGCKEALRPLADILPAVTTRIALAGAGLNLPEPDALPVIEPEDEAGDVGAWVGPEGYENSDDPAWANLSPMRRQQLRRARGWENMQATKRAIAERKHAAEQMLGGLHARLADSTHVLNQPCRFVDVGELPAGTPCLFLSMDGQDALTGNYLAAVWLAGKRRRIVYSKLKEVGMGCQ